MALLTFSGITRVSWYQKGKINLDFTEARDNVCQWHQLGHIQICTSPETDNHASNSPLSFYRPDALPAAQPTASKHWRYIALDVYHLQQKKRQKTLAKIKQLNEEESDGRAVQQKGSSSRKRTPAKGGKGKDKAPKKTGSQKGTKQNETMSKCSILPYFTVKK